MYYSVNIHSAVQHSVKPFPNILITTTGLPLAVDLNLKWYSSSGHTEKHAINKQLFGGATCQKRERAIQNNLKLALSN